jgi:hypothetical protein
MAKHNLLLSDQKASPFTSMAYSLFTPSPTQLHWANYYYHYTSEQGMLGILDSKEIMMSTKSNIFC